MKRLIIVALSLVLVNNTWAQSEPKEYKLSSTEAFSSKVGSLIQKEFVEVGILKKTQVQVVHLTDLISEESISAIRLVYKTSGTYSRTKIALLDSDEINGLKKAIKIIQDQVLTTTPRNYTEVAFSSRSGFIAGSAWSNYKWRAYIQLKENDSDSIVLLKQADFPILLDLLSEAMSLIK